VKSSFLARLLMAGVLVLFWAGHAHAEVVADNRLKQLDGLPTLGRGYNIQENTLHSVCFKEVKASEPVFDFYYEFDKVDANFLQRLSSNSGNWAADGELTDFLNTHIQEPDSSEDRTDTVNIVARISLESYNKTLDESGSPVSPSARTLVEEGRFPAFFSACGFFYVRSVRYSSSFMALFQYTHSGSHEADARFEERLRRGLLEFEAEARAKEMEQESMARGLKIFVRGAGLGRTSQMVNLVPTSLREFRQSIQAAAQLMQAAPSGVITSMEVAPWIEHPDLRSSFFSVRQPGESTFGKTKKLELNSQLITSINGTRSHWLNEYYLASLCRQQLLEYYPVDASSISGQFDVVYDAERTLFQNHRHRADPRRRITLRQFREYFQKVPPETFLEKADRFLKGSENDGADACVSALLEEGLDRAEFALIPSCVKAMAELNVQDRFLRNFCLPTPVNRVYKGLAP
jgi:hypothetical protein